MSDQPYADGNGVYAADFGLHQTQGGQFNAKFNAGDLGLRFLVDPLQVHTVDAMDTMAAEPVPVDFLGVYGEARYDVRPSPAVTITPRLNIKSQMPWYAVTEGMGLAYNSVITRTTANLTASWDVQDNLNILGGVEEWFDYAENHMDPAEADPYSNGEMSIVFNNVSLFAQAFFRTSWANLVVGGRADIHSEFDPAFSPRIGITRAWERVHLKFLAGRAFRAPVLENINFSEGQIKPEKTTSIEVEAGVVLSRSLLLTVNLFDLSISDPIIYFYDSAAALDGYLNGREMASSGLEAELRSKQGWGDLTAGYSYYQTDLFGDRTDVDNYADGGKAGRNLALPQHKLTSAASVKLGRVTLSPSLALISARGVYSMPDTVDVFSKLDPAVFINLWASWRLHEGLTVGAGVFDLLDEGLHLVQPYNDGHPVVPGRTREVAVRLNWDLPL